MILASTSVTVENQMRLTSKTTVPILHRRRWQGCRLGLVLLGWVLTGGLLSAQSERTTAEQTPVFGETVDVRVVNLEVVVTDRKGQRIKGLGAQDFELRLDGESVPIEYFSEIDEGIIQDAGEIEAVAPGGLEAGEPVATSYLLFIDEFFSITRDRDRLIDRLIDQVSSMGPEDRMAVVRYDGKQLERLSGWTRGKPLIQALRQAERQPSQGLRRLMEQRSALRPTELDLYQRGLASETTRLSLEERYLVDRLESQLDRVVKAAVSTLRSFAAPPGRKTMLLLSGGWPFDPVEYIVDDVQRALYDSPRKRFGEIYDPLRDTANLLGYTLYPVDVPGFQTSGISADTGISTVARDRTSGRFILRESGLHRSLEYLAKETGGKALINSSRDQMFDIVRADTRSYYWLGFAPVRSGDDQRHDIQVIVKNPDWRVRSRGDFFDFSRKREVTLAVESALYFGSPPSELPLSVKIGKGKRSGLRTMVVPMDLLIPAESVTLLPGPGGFVGQLELRVAVLDKDGATTDTPIVPLTLRLEKKPSADAMLAYSTRLKLRRKEQRLVVAIYDLATGGILSSSLEVTP